MRTEDLSPEDHESFYLDLAAIADGTLVERMLKKERAEAAVQEELLKTQKEVSHA